MDRKTVKKVIFVCITMILIGLILYSGLRILESTVFYMEPDQWVQDRKTIVRDGVRYYPRQDITTVMVLGINRRGPVEPTAFNEGGAADMITLVVFDEKEENYSILSINRDSMMDIPVLMENGKIDGSFFGQAGYAHTYGTGMEDSCENTQRAISNFLGGIGIDYYVALNMDAISILNDAVGGVTVTVKDDFSLVDPSLQKGEITLSGEQAVNFVQARKGVGDSLNVSRVQRQQEYMESFLKSLDAGRKKDTAFVLKIYEKLSGYIVSNCSANVISGMLDRYGSYTLKENVTPEGKNVVGEYMEYHVDAEKLDELAVRLFYAPK